jgi:hypothetical protein
VRVQSSPLPHGDISAALDSGRLDFRHRLLAHQCTTHEHVELLHDCYVVLLRSGHPGV